jgi:four helix bundle protein
VALMHYRELIAWQKAMDLVVAVYQVTLEFPREEAFGLTSQLRRAAVSVPSNIAEGQGRKSTKEFLHHLSMAYGSLCEVETQIVLSERLAYLEPAKSGRVLDLAAEVGKLINGLSRSLSTDRPHQADGRRVPFNDASLTTDH